MGVLTGSPIQTQPTFNPMIGPSTYLLINMGARFTPCMHGIDKITNDPMLRFPCPNSTTVTTNVCSLAELCGMAGGVVDPAGLETAIKAGATDANTAPLKPNQWWRFITPIFCTPESFIWDSTCCCKSDWEEKLSKILDMFGS